MRGGPSLKLREDWWVFEDLLRLREDWWVFERPLLMLRRFSESLFQGRFTKNKAYFLIVSKKYQNLIRNPT